MTQSRGRGIGAVLIANLRGSPAKSAVLVAGAIVLVVLLIRLAVRGGPASAQAEVAIVPPAAAEAAAALLAAPAPVQTAPRHVRPRLRQMPAARDPFSLAWLNGFNGAATVVDEEVSGDLVLQLIMTAGKSTKGLAVVSGVVVHPGSTVGTYVVEEIADRYVVLRNSAGTRTLRMP